MGAFYDHADNSKIWQSEGNEILTIWCPGCKDLHQVFPSSMPKQRASDPRWQIHSINPLTISPSLLVTCRYGGEAQERRCHSFIKNGKWQFLSDCTHELAGQTVPMAKIPEDW